MILTRTWQRFVVNHARGLCTRGRYAVIVRSFVTFEAAYLVLDPFQRNSARPSRVIRP